MTTGEKIQYYRKKLSLSQEELGQKLLVSRQTVSLWENGQTAPTIDNLVRLKEIFGVSVDELLGCEAEAAESHEADPDTPVPSESYSVSFYKNELDKIYKYILKLSFRKPVISIIILAIMLAVYISLDIHDVLVGVFAGVLFIFVVSVLKQFLSHRKVWRESTERVAQSRYEYRVY
ncbi:MAG: helix-turn-helix transcriptional regulator, partial [Clostridia bacterium]|nr:helix-turn-helix transcriptional regulator [Clostridia bacterium]